MFLPDGTTIFHDNCQGTQIVQGAWEIIFTYGLTTTESRPQPHWESGGGFVQQSDSTIINVISWWIYTSCDLMTYVLINFVNSCQENDFITKKLHSSHCISGLLTWFPWWRCCYDMSHHQCWACDQEWQQRSHFRKYRDWAAEDCQQWSCTIRVWGCSHLIKNCAINKEKFQFPSRANFLNNQGAIWTIGDKKKSFSSTMEQHSTSQMWLESG